MPKKIIQLVKVVCKSFMWTGSNEITKNIVILGEDLPTLDKGGFNVIDMEIWNKNSLCKHLWSL